MRVYFVQHDPRIICASIRHPFSNLPGRRSVMTIIGKWFWALVILILADASALAQPPRERAQVSGGKFNLADGVDIRGVVKQMGATIGRIRVPEFVEYIYWNLTGEGQGWFHPGESRYSWKWLAARHDADATGAITRQKFKGPAKWFDKLDRNRDGVLTAADFEWPLTPGAEMQGMLAGPPGRGGQSSEREGMLKRVSEMTAGQIFKLADRKRDGTVSKQEWLDLFSKVSKGKDHLTPEDLSAALAPSGPRSLGGKQMANNVATVRIQGMLKSETGSIFEGPAVDQLAPKF